MIENLFVIWVKFNQPFPSSIIPDSTNSQSSRLNHLRCPPIHQNYLQNYTPADNIPAVHRLCCNTSHVELQNMSNVVSQHGKILHRSHFRCLFSRGSNYSQSTDGGYETVGFYMEASSNRFVSLDKINVDEIMRKSFFFLLS